MKVDPIKRFPYAKLPDGRLTREAACGQCGYLSHVSDTSSGLPTDIIARKLDQRGWRIGSRPKDDRCPDCIRAEKALRKHHPDTKVVHLHQDTVAMSQPTPIAAAPPRQPTREDRRRILDALEEAYDTKSARYIGDGSDAMTAARLDVPRAWVSAIREDLFGPDENEQEALSLQAIAELDARLKAMSEEFMAKYAKLESDVAALKAGRLPKAA